MAKQTPDPRVFPYNPKSIGANFTRACRLRGLHDLHFHDLHHETTSHLFERGYDIPQVAQFTLHESCTTLKRYTHLRPEQVLEKAPPFPPANRSYVIDVHTPMTYIAHDLHRDTHLHQTDQSPDR